MRHITTSYETRRTLWRTWATSVERHQIRRLCWSGFAAVTRPRLTQVVDVVVLPQDQRLFYACHQYSLRIFRKDKWRSLVTKIEAKEMLCGEGKKKRKGKKERRKIPWGSVVEGLRKICPLSVFFFRVYHFYSCFGS